jgi:hypothetical protein
MLFGRRDLVLVMVSVNHAVIRPIWEGEPGSPRSTSPGYTLPRVILLSFCPSTMNDCRYIRAFVL